MVLNRLSAEYSRKEKPEQEACAYRMLEFQDVGNLQKKINFTPDNRVSCEAPFVRHNSIFCWTLFMSGANIQV